jgi:hypothetical protein
MLVRWLEQVNGHNRRSAQVRQTRCWPRYGNGNQSIDNVGAGTRSALRAPRCAPRVHNRTMTFRPRQLGRFLAFRSLQQARDDGKPIATRPALHGHPARERGRIKNRKLLPGSGQTRLGCYRAIVVKDRQHRPRPDRKCSNWKTCQAHRLRWSADRPRHCHRVQTSFIIVNFVPMPLSPIRDKYVRIKALAIIASNASWKILRSWWAPQYAANRQLPSIFEPPAQGILHLLHRAPGSPPEPPWRRNCYCNQPTTPRRGSSPPPSESE